MSDVAEVAYLWVKTADLTAHAAFVSDVIGLQAVAGDKDSEAGFRSDIRRRTVVLTDDPQAIGAVGLAYHTPEALEKAADRVREAGRPLIEADPETCARLFVRRAFRAEDPSGNPVDLVLGPHHSGRRFFPARDNGIEGLEGIVMRSRLTAEDIRFWTVLLGFELRDRVGEAVYIGTDALHHRVALFPSDRPGVLAVNFAVEDMEQVMINQNFLKDRQIRIAQGPGRAAASGQIFVQVHGPDGLIYGFVTGTRVIDPARHHAKQFDPSDALCCWGSRPNGVPEYEPESVNKN
ncbi:MAG: VOC family protein [Marinosulfonomonas sp.]|nr:VOC family protein [Marinosulfonomonas sp.]